LAHTPLGVFRNVQRSVYDEQVRRQVVETIESQGEGDLGSLLRGKDTWVVA
jgi:2-oxoglutarate ferredoxin oxidoreductase subunit beta